MSIWRLSFRAPVKPTDQTNLKGPWHIHRLARIQTADSQFPVFGSDECNQYLFVKSSLKIKDESHECTSEIYETENKQPGGAEEQDEDEEEERPALSPHAIPVYMCFCWAPPCGKQEGHGKQIADWPNGWMEISKPIQVEQGMLGGKRGPVGPCRAGMLAAD
ncbi:hypothetical protein FQA47_019081 [Oryzias melastigma]|uniref:Uncharacterized protein n=1 Tax=Oryzias melastigma TaxID=30732 RepID=A0A834FK49_ORYME|nr:hypothetical protein FQA47_019081 [Oryzias melastigma]